MENFCYMEECECQAEFICYCAEIPTYSCGNHFGIHLMLKRNHSVQESLFYLLEPEESQSLYQKIMTFERQIRETIKKIQIDTKVLIDSITSEHHKSINYFKSLRIEALKISNNLINQTKMDKKLFEKITEVLKFIELQNNPDREELRRRILKFYLRDNYFYKPNRDLESENLCFFKDSSKNLTLVSIDKPSRTVQINIPNCFNSDSASCEISDNKYFFYGGFNPYISNVCIIDIETKTGTAKKNGKEKANMGCCYYKDKVYVFGGYNNQYLKDAERYDLITDAWQNLPSLPTGCAAGRCFGLKDSIIYTGFISTSILTYSILNNSYSEYGNFASNENKIICNIGNKIYVFVSGHLYKITHLVSSELRDAKKFASKPTQLKLVNENTGIPNTNVLTSRTLKDKNFYFVLEDFKLYKFDLETESIAILKII